MDDRLHFAPWWKLFLLIGLPTGLVIGLLSGDDVPFALVAGPVSALFAGGLAVATAWYHRHGVAHLVGSLSPEERTVVLRAAANGPIPADPRLHAAAARYAEHALRRATRTRNLVMLFLGLIVLLQVYSAVTDFSWWRVFFTAALVIVLLAQLWPVARLRRRSELLNQTPEPT